MGIRCAVMGHPIDHSLSPLIHQRFAEQTGLSLCYEKIKVDPLHFEAQVTAFFKQEGLGLNITLPCKQQAFTMSQYPSARCAAAKAANTLWMESGCLHADNTDGVGLLKDLSRYLSLSDQSVVLLGSGGAARGVLGPLLAAHPARVTLVARSEKNAQPLIADHPSALLCTFDALPADLPCDLLINATSAGLQGTSLVLPDTLLQHRPLCYDLSYQQQGETPFVAWARRHACTAYDGLGMLVEQAAAAFYIWHGIMPNTEPVLQWLKKICYVGRD